MANTQIINSKEAYEIAKQAREDGSNALLRKCMRSIKFHIEIGLTEFVIEIPEIPETEWAEPSEIYLEVIEPVVNSLEGLGYSVEIEDEAFIVQVKPKLFSVILKRQTYFTCARILKIPS